MAARHKSHTWCKTAQREKIGKEKRGETRWSCQLHSITSVFPAERCQEMSRIALIQWHTACTAFCTLHPSCSWYKWTWGSRRLTCIHCSSPALPRISGKTSPPPLQCPGKHQVSPGTATKSWRRIRPSKKKMNGSKIEYDNTSSTAQGGGGSFKNRKPIGELGCCESGMAERSHWWTERCLISLTLSLSFSDYLPTYLSIFYVSIYLSIFLV